MPATLTKMSIRPNNSFASATFVGMVSNAATLNSSAFAWPPCALISSATPCAALRFRSARMTFVPYSAKRRALASPIPRPPPVIMATLPWSISVSIIKILPFLSLMDRLSKCVQSGLTHHLAEGRMRNDRLLPLIHRQAIGDRRGSHRSPHWSRRHRRSIRQHYPHRAS